jgi:cyclic pyranopterin phosphate synthase
MLAANALRAHCVRARQCATVQRRAFGVLTHIDSHGGVAVPGMVDVGAKAVTDREAVAQACVRMPLHSAKPWAGSDAVSTSVRQALYATVTTAGIMGCKQTAQLIPMCHPLPLHKVSIAISEPEAEAAPEAAEKDHMGQQQGQQEQGQQQGHVQVRITCTARTSGKTGVEMEALTGASIAALTMYDMLKSSVKGSLEAISIEQVRLIRKTGGQSHVAGAVKTEGGHR